jgi:hypothetical protein
MRPIFGPSQTLMHLNVSGQPGPNHGPGGNSYDQKPPEHPHDSLGYQNARLIGMMRFVAEFLIVFLCALWVLSLRSLRLKSFALLH